MNSTHEERVWKAKNIDTFFFRDGRPFGMGAETWAKGVFPPYPQTIHGALYTALRYPQVNPSEKQQMKLKALWLQKGNTIYLPAPASLLQTKDRQIKNLMPFNVPEWVAVSPVAKAQASWLLWLEAQGKAEPLTGKAWMAVDKLEEWLKNSDSSSLLSESLIFIEEMLVYEPKIGIALQRSSRTVREGHLYRVEMVRLKEDYVLGGILEAPSSWFSDANSRITRFGAEGKLAKVDFFKDVPDMWVNLKNMWNNNKLQNGPGEYILLYFATPLPVPEDSSKHNDALEWLALLLKESGMSANLCAAALPSYMVMGGWDMASSRPKPMCRAIPAGSVLFLKVSGGRDQAGQIVKKLHGKSLLEAANNNLYQEWINLGVGIIFVGKWKPRKSQAP